MIFLLQENFPIVLGLLIATLGACFGSFAALIIHRMPKNISIITPSSYCSACKSKIKAWHNIPILSWFHLGGKCAYCRVPFGKRSLILEIIFMLCALVIYRQVGLSIAFIDKFGFVFLLICLAYIDLDTYYLPLSLLVVLLGWGILFTLIYSVDPHLFKLSSPPPGFLKLMVFGKSMAFSLSNRLWGALWGLLSLSVVNVVGTLLLRFTGRLNSNQWAMGWGDPLLLMVIALVVGQNHLLLVIFLASFLGSVVGIATRLTSPKYAQSEDIAAGALPYGPFLAIAGIYTYLL